MSIITFLRKHALESLYSRWEPEDEKETDWCSVKYSRFPSHYLVLSKFYGDWDRRQRKGELYRLILTRVMNDDERMKIVIDYSTEPYLVMAVTLNQRGNSIEMYETNLKKLGNCLIRIRARKEEKLKASQNSTDHMP